MLVLYHDVPSAGSLVAMLRLQLLADEGLSVTFRGFDVLGLEMTVPATVADLEDWERHRDEAAQLGWELPRPVRHPATVPAHLVGELAAEHGLGAAWRLAAYRAHWLERRDLTSYGVLLDLAAFVGVPEAPVTNVLHDREQRQGLWKRMLVHRGEGVGGVPVLDANGTFVSPFMELEDLRMLAEL